MEAMTKFLFGVLIVGCLLFLPANSFEYCNAWIFMGLLFIPMFIVGIFLMIKNPNLLRRRLNSKESEKDQKMVLVLSGLMFISGFIVASLNYKYSWIILPNYIVIIGIIIFVISYILYGVVLKENEFLLRTIEVEKNQKVIDTGLYSFVRHPMYLITILLFLSIPLILNSIISLFIFLMYPIIIVIRIKNEECVLEKDLIGYIDYKKKVKYRLIPFIW